MPEIHYARSGDVAIAYQVVGDGPIDLVFVPTFATFALRAGISTFDLSRYMGTSLAMIDRHYGHLARDGREHAIRLLDSYKAAEALDVHPVAGASRP